MKYALLFPGQGSQEVGMLKALGAEHAVVDETFREASDVLGWDLLQLVKDGPAEQLNKTQRTQPALLAAGVAVWRAWLAASNVPAPSALAGHSLGEYTALVAAGALTFADALKLVELRGNLMQAAVAEGVGAMAAVIGLDDQGVEKACAAYDGDGVLEAANYNAPGQVVVAGTRWAIDWLVANSKQFGARKVMPIPVSVPSHCSLMRPAADQLAERLRDVDVQRPQVPVLHNLDAQARTEAAEIREALIQQLYRPVRWSLTIRNLHEQGVSGLFECGPGKVLTGIGKRVLDVAPEAARFLPLGELIGFAEAQSLFTTQTMEQA
jgi:[acyl-carrier-protein] S-malonyltransferase